MSESDLKQCAADFPSWYTGTKYLLRLEELFICAAAFLAFVKFIYISVSPTISFHGYAINANLYVRKDPRLAHAISAAL